MSSARMQDSLRTLTSTETPGLNAGDRASGRRRLVAAACRRKTVDPMDIPCRLHVRALTWRAQGAYGRAAVAGRRALRLAEGAVGPDHPDVANILINLAGIAEVKGDYAAAQRQAERAVTITEPVSGDADLVLLHIQALSCLASVYRIQGRYEAAEPLCQQALAQAEAALGRNHLEVASSCNNLAVLYKYTGQFSAAARLYRRALKIIEGALGSDHPDVASICHNLGGLAHARRAFARGEPWARRAVAIRTRALGPDHPDVAADQAALAALLDGQGKYVEAEALYRHALSVFEVAFGPTHYDVAITCNNLAALAHAQG